MFPFNFSRWLKSQTKTAPRTPIRNKLLLGVESLEDRTVPSHYRSTVIDWVPVAGSPRTIEFHLTQSWASQPAVGSTVTPASFSFGDGSTANINLTVTSVSAADNAYVGKATLTHTYSTNGDFTAFMSGGNRISTLKNNHDGAFRTETRVNVGTGNSSPVSSLAPIVQVADNQIWTFQLSTASIDPNSDTLTYRLATAAEAAYSTAAPTAPSIANGQPLNFSVSSTGLVTWDLRDSALATVPNDLWTTQIIVEDRSAGGTLKSYIPLDFILKVGQPAAVNAQPTVTASPAGPFQPIAGQTLTFNVTATDSDGTITGLQALNAPAGMTFSSFGSPAATKTITATWTPTQAQAGQTVVVNFQATDNTGATGNASVTISPAANQAPVANNDTYTINEDNQLVVAAPGVLFNDTDAENNPFTAALVSTTTNGALTFNNNGSFTYTPNAHFFGTDSFTYRNSDATGTGNTATVTITVNPVNDPPTANSDTTSTNEDTPVTINVITNDSAGPANESGQTLTPIIAAGAMNGQVVVNPNRTITYTPAANYFGPDSFTYYVNDGSANSNTVAVNITVNPINDEPIANDDLATTNEDTPVDIAVLLNDLAGPNNESTQTLAVTHLKDAAGVFVPVVAGGTVATAHGTVRLNANGTVTYTPAPNYNGPDSFAYTIRDSGSPPLSDSANGTVTINAVNDPPVAVNDGYTVAEDGVLTIAAAQGVLANDTDADAGTTLSVVGTQAITAPQHGLLTLNANGSFTYTPFTNFNGTDTFTYKASDGIADSNLATVTITVTSVNDAPVVNDDSAITNEDTPVQISVLDNDFDVDGNMATVASPRYASYQFTGTVTSLSGTVPGDGVATGNAISGTFVFDRSIPDSGANALYGYFNHGALAAPNGISITINGRTFTADSGGNFSVQSFAGLPFSHQDAIHIGAYGPDAASGAAREDIYVYLQDATNAALPTDVLPAVLSLTNFGNSQFQVSARDAAGNLIYEIRGTLATLTAGAPVLVPEARLVSGPANGSAVFDVATGKFTYTPNANFNGTDSFVYEVLDQNGASDTGTVTITVNPVNDAPVAVNDSYSTNEDTQLVVTAPGVKSNDADVDGDQLTVSLVSAPTHGGVALSADGSFTYTPDTDFFGTDTFTYKVNDGAASSNVATVTITVNPVNDAPLLSVDHHHAVGPTHADPKEGELAKNHGTYGEVDPGDTVTLSASIGTIIDNGNGTWKWTYQTSDDILPETLDVEITAADNHGASTTRVFHLQVENVAPTAVADAGATDEDHTTSGNVLTNDTDPAGANDPLTAVPFTITTAKGATVTLNANGSYTYDPRGSAALQSLKHGVVTTDTFDYTVSDGDGGFDTGTVTITVTGVNDAPVGQDDFYTVSEDEVLNVAAPGVLANDSDPDGDPVQVNGYYSAAHGTVAIYSNGAFSYTPNANFNGTDSFVYEVGDGHLFPDPLYFTSRDYRTVYITVTAVNDTPVVSAGGAESLNEGGTLIRSGSFTDPDAGESWTATVDYGDGSGEQPLAIGPNNTFALNHTYTDNGLYPVTVRVKDGSNAVGSTSFQATVNNVDPEAILSNNGEVDEGSEGSVSFSGATDVSSDDTAAGLRYAFDFDGDGTFEIGGDGSYAQGVTSASVVVPASFLADGTSVRTVTGRVIDKNDGFTEYTTDITVRNVNPTFEAGADETLQPPVVGAFSRTGTAITDPGAEVFAGTVDFGDGTGPQALVIDQGARTFDLSHTFPNTTSDPAVATYTVTVVVNDGDGGSHTDAFKVTVKLNTPPVAVDDSVTTDENTGVTFSVLANDTDSQNNIVPSLTVNLTSPAQGTLTNNGDGTFTYDPGTAFQHLAVNESAQVSFDYSVVDAFGASDEGTVTITISGVNDAPVAVGVAASASEDGPAQPVTADYSDIDVSDTHTFAVSTTGTLGTVVNNGDGTFSYDPNGAFEYLAAGETATDTFDYTVGDGNGGASSATVTVTITGQNDAPVVSPVSRTTDEDAGTFSVDLLAASGATDVDPTDGLSVTAVAQASGRPIAFAKSGNTLTFDANQFNDLAFGESATLVFTFTVSDDSAAPNASTTKTATITVHGRNDSPSVAAGAATVTVNEGQTASNAGSFHDFDLSDRPTITASIGTITQEPSNAGAWSWSFATGDNTDSQTVTVTANDGHGGVATVTFALVVDNVAPAVVLSGAVSADEGQTKHYTFTTSDPGADTFAVVATSGGAVGTVTNLVFNAATGSGSFDVTFADGGATPTTSTVSIQLKDSDGALSNVASRDVAVSNVPPAVTIAGPTTGQQGFAVAFSGTATDRSPVDAAAGFAYSWSVTKGGQSVDLTGIATSGTAFSYVPAEAGTYVVTLTATDKDGGATSVSRSVAVAAVAGITLLPGGLLVIVGTDAADDIKVNPGGGAPDIKVKMNGAQQTFVGVTRIVIYANGGNDTVQIVGGITLPVTVFGGAGNDNIKAGGGDSVLVGGDGDDVLLGGAGRDVLIGGKGADLLGGSGADDLLIAGYAAIDSNLLALGLVQAEWVSGRSFADRVANLAGTSPAGAPERTGPPSSRPAGRGERCSTTTPSTP